MRAETTAERHASSVVGPRHGRELAALIVYSPDVARVGHLLALRRPVTIGRDSESVDCAINDSRLSRRHVVLHADGLLSVVDASSKNGTFVDGVKVVEVKVSAGAVIRIGDTHLVIDEFLPGRAEGSSHPPLIGSAPAIERMVADIERLAPTMTPVLIMGETGTGKELVARRVHDRSGRKGPFVVINCGAIPGGLAESILFGHKRGAFTGAVGDSRGSFPAADGGTLFLDEVGELPLELQPKLLRVLETSEVTPIGGTEARKLDVRIVAATNADLEAEIIAGSFRADLFARLRGFVVEPPTLRQRKSDIPVLTRHFLRELLPGREVSFTANFVDGMLLHSWPHNVRELRMAAQRFAVLIGSDGLCHATLLEELGAAGVARKTSVVKRAPQDLDPPPPREELVAIIKQLSGNMVQVAEHFGKHRKQIYRWCERYGIALADYRR